MGVFGGRAMLTGKEKPVDFSSPETCDFWISAYSVCFSLQNGCAYVGCGESHTDHSTVHSQVRDLSDAFQP